MTIANQFGVQGLPATFFVDDQGGPRGEVLGPVSHAGLVEAAGQIST